MMVVKISTEHKAEIDRLEDEFSKEINSLQVNEKNLKIQLEDYSSENSDLKKKLSENSALLKKL